MGRSERDHNNPRKRRHDDIGSLTHDGIDPDDRSTIVTTTGTTLLEPYILARVGNERRRIPQSTFLSSIWKDGCLDSACMVCNEPFDFTDMSSAPIRTIGFDYSQLSQTQASVIDITQAPLTPHPIRIYNRHLECIKENNIDFIPISHAWHEEIALAQDNGVDNINAAFLAYQVPVKTLLAATRKYGRDVEIWHDYLSVPQWQKKTQQELLLSIPAIYNYPESIIIHLDDVRTDDLTQAYEDHSYGTFVEGLVSVIRSRWFDRMWVTLEYIQGKEVLVASKEYELVDFNAGDLSLRIENVVASYIKRDGHGTFMNDVISRGTRWGRKVSWTDMESWKGHPEKPRTFGAATHILGMKHCRDPRDYYFALGGMIGFNPGADIDSHQAQGAGHGGDSFEYFFSLAVHALAGGDYTPLLVNPIPGEKPDLRAPWVRGYSQMSERLWDLGVCHRPARCTEIIRDGVIQPELESVGVVDWLDIGAFNLGESSSTSKMFMGIVIEIVRSIGTCPVAFTAAIDRIFAGTERKGLYTEWENDSGSKARKSEHTHAYGSSSASIPDNKLGDMLEKVSALMHGGGMMSAWPANHSTNNHKPRANTNLGGNSNAMTKMQNLSREIVTHLRLDKPSKHSADSRLTITQSEAQWYWDRFGERDMESLARVRCKYCGRRFMIRLTLWQEPSPGALLDSGGLVPGCSCQVYRIPGLLFDETVPDGVGLVVEWNYPDILDDGPSVFGRVIGKMIYGTGAGTCECRRLERVRLGNATLENKDK